MKTTLAAVGHNMSKYWQLVSVEGGQVTGTFMVAAPDKRKETWVTAYDVTVWSDDERRHGRVLYSGDFTCAVRDGNAEIHAHMIASNKRDDVLSELDDMKAAVLAAVEAFDADRAAAH